MKRREGYGEGDYNFKVILRHLFVIILLLLLFINVFTFRILGSRILQFRSRSSERNTKRGGAPTYINMNFPLL